MATSTEAGWRSGAIAMLTEHHTTTAAPATIVGRSAARWPIRQAASLDIVVDVRTPARLFRGSVPMAALQVSQVTRTAAPTSSANANTIAPPIRLTLPWWHPNGNVSPRFRVRVQLHS